jgi:hypothetical protein
MSRCNQPQQLHVSKALVLSTRPMRGEVATTSTTLATPETRSRTQRCFMRSVATKRYHVPCK